MGRPLRVIQLVNALAPGGAEVFAVDLACRMSREGADVTLVSTTEYHSEFRDELEKRLAAAGVEHVPLNKPVHKRDLGVLLRFRRVLTRVKPDIVHSHCDVATWFNGCFTGLFYPRAKRVCTLHNVNEEFLKSFPANWLKPWNTFHRVICVSQASYDQTEKVPHKSVLFVARDLSGFLDLPDARADVREELGIGADEVVFLHIGRMSDEQKNHEVMIPAFGALSTDVPVRLLLAGYGSRQEEFEKLAAESDPHGRIRFLGVRSDIPRLHAAADVLALPSLWEGRPVVGMEAMAAGLPCLFTPVPPLLEIGQGVDGLHYCEGTDFESVRDGFAEAVRQFGLPRWRRDRAERERLVREMGIEACVQAHWGPKGYNVGPTV